MVANGELCGQLPTNLRTSFVYVDITAHSTDIRLVIQVITLVRRKLGAADGVGQTRWFN